MARVKRAKRRSAPPGADASGNLRDKNAKFLPGGAGGPGRTPGISSGRTAALGRLDALLGIPENLDKLSTELQKKFDADPVRFFRVYVMPLIPRSQVIKMEGIEKTPIRILFPESTKGKPNGKADKSKGRRGSHR